MQTFVENHGRENVRKIFFERKSSAVSSLSVHQPTERALFAKLRWMLITVFLPQGYPDTVSPDYAAYQVWDTVQAFASSMTSALATEAVLKSAGVGDQAASALAASLTWLVKDGLGMIGRILFTYIKGTELDSDCKKWRFVADILNDLSFCIDLLSPYFRSWFFVSSCTASLFRCIVGVAGGATRATIVEHQARRNNLADVSAKDGSQETIVNVVALVSSLILLPLVSGHSTLIWILFVVFTSIHLYANYRAVRSLKIDTVNRKRAAIAIRQFCKEKTVPAVVECNDAEPLFRSATSESLHLGCSLHDLLARFNRDPSLPLHVDEQFYLLNDEKSIWIAMREGSSSRDQLRSFFYALSRQFSKETFESFVSTMEREKWNLSTHHLGFDEWRYREEH